jgi:hypothetical protein
MPRKTPTAPPDTHVSDCIETRMVELGILSITDLAAATGMTDNGIRPVIKGERRSYQRATKVKLARALQWPPDAIDRLYAGDHPDDSWEASSPSSDGGAVLDAIRADRDLDEEARVALALIYRSMVETSAGRR